MFGFLSGKSLRQFTGTIVGEFAEKCPPPAPSGVKPISKQNAADSLKVLYGRVEAFVREHRLGTLGRARLAKTLQEEMHRHGYPDEMASQVISAVTVNALVAPGRR